MATDTCDLCGEDTNDLTKCPLCLAMCCPECIGVTDDGDTCITCDPGAEVGNPTGPSPEENPDATSKPLDTKDASDDA